VFIGSKKLKIFYETYIASFKVKLLRFFVYIYTPEIFLESRVVSCKPLWLRLGESPRNLSKLGVLVAAVVLDRHAFPKPWPSSRGTVAALTLPTNTPNINVKFTACQSKMCDT